MEIHIHLFQKELTLSDTSNHQCKLIIPKKDVEGRFLTFWTPEQMNEGVHLQVFDMDEGRELLTTHEQDPNSLQDSPARSCSSR